MTEAVRRLRFTDELLGEKNSIEEENSRCLGWILGRIEKFFPKEDVGIAAA